MKKLLVLALPMIACITHAATVKWNSGSYSDGFVGPDGNSLASSTAYTATCYFYSDAGTTEIVSARAVDDSASKGSYSGTTGDYFSANTTYYTKIVITAKDNSYQITSDLASFTLPGTGSSSINFTSGFGFDTVSAKMNSSTGWAPVPEPTSLGLMMLGLAGLALRRRHA